MRRLTLRAPAGIVALVDRARRRVGNESRSEYIGRAAISRAVEDIGGMLTAAEAEAVSTFAGRFAAEGERSPLTEPVMRLILELFAAVTAAVSAEGLDPGPEQAARLHDVRAAYERALAPLEVAEAEAVARPH